MWYAVRPQCLPRNMTFNIMRFILFMLKQVTNNIILYVSAYIYIYIYTSMCVCISSFIDHLKQSPAYAHVFSMGLPSPSTSQRRLKWLAVLWDFLLTSGRTQTFEGEGWCGVIVSTSFQNAWFALIFRDQLKIMCRKIYMKYDITINNDIYKILW